ncbi:MAG: TIGR02281 family clan AA aspartic protease, partial [Halocynthiibacter sp.]
ATLVVLTHDDALRIGIDVGALRYNVPVQTANGTAKNALVHLQEITVGSITISNIRALIAKPEQLETSLLGMSFLSRLTSFQIGGDQLVLRN